MEAAEFSAPQRDYILACAGCHGIQGLSNPDLVPSLQGLVGYFLELPEGRAYLSRLPNVAFSTLSDERLAAVLNYMVFEIGGASAPAGDQAVRCGRGRGVSQAAAHGSHLVGVSPATRGDLDSSIPGTRDLAWLRGHDGAGGGIRRDARIAAEIPEPRVSEHGVR